MSTEPPPLYTQDASDSRPLSPSSEEDGAAEYDDPQILIIPPSQSAQFQKGFLGAEDERAAIEGELQIKGVCASRCQEVKISLRSVETAFDRDVELFKSEIILFSRTSSTELVPSSFPFAIPLTPDTPQCLSTLRSSLTHTLTAAVLSASDLLPVLSKSIVVQPRRYTSHSHISQVSPVTRTLDTPTRVEVQVPRTTFKSDEIIPVYVTIPSPRRELVVDDGVRLRNIRAELVRVIKVRAPDEKAEPDSSSTRGFNFDSDIDDEFGLSTLDPTSSTPLGDSKPSSSSSQSSKGWTTKAVITRSGAACRFHSSLPIRQRLLLHQPLESPCIIPTDFPQQPQQQNLEQELDYPLITQTTVLHSVTFRLLVHTTFVNMSQRTEQVHTILIPILLIPPTAPLSEVDEDLEFAYRKKHDRPPQRTVRGDDTENTPNYEEAGPSGGPPPFEELDAPPPFSEPEASTSNGLPTFLEAETEIFAPSSQDTASLSQPPLEFSIPGEGTLFGFSTLHQFDGHMVDLERQRSTTPPPTMEMATKDPDVTDLASMDQPELAMEVLSLALERHEEASTNDLSPPPLVVDDPSDPPPSIDSDFSDAHGMARQPPPPPAPSQSPPPHSSSTTSPSVVDGHDGHAPPPYLNSDNHHHDGSGPPPYIDVMPSRN